VRRALGDACYQRPGHRWSSTKNNILIPPATLRAPGRNTNEYVHVLGLTLLLGGGDTLQVADVNAVGLDSGPQPQNVSRPVRSSRSALL
jgi:hypothetical protein